MRAARTLWSALLLFLVVYTALPDVARAVDGVIQINHDRAIAGGITGTDTPGYPIELGESGSYRLTSDLPGGIVVLVDSISIDLNGFAIDGSSFTARGISDLGISVADVRVSNGSVRNFTVDCIRLGDQVRVSNVRTSGCQNGIRVGDHSLVIRSSAESMTAESIQTGRGSHVSSSLAEGGSADGLDIGSRSVVVENTSRNNFIGIRVDQDSVVRGNLVAGGSWGILGAPSTVAEGNLVSSASGTALDFGDDSAVTLNRVSDSGFGVVCNDRCSVKDNQTTGATNTGLLVLDRSNVVDNLAANSTSPGFRCVSACHLVGNSAIGSGGNGFDVPVGSLVGSYKDNTLNANTTGDISQAGLDPGFGNSCSGALPCP